MPRCATPVSELHVGEAEPCHFALRYKSRGERTLSQVDGRARAAAR